MPGKNKASRLLKVSSCCYILLAGYIFLFLIASNKPVLAADIQASAAVPSQTQNNKKLRYQVRSGDSLLRIAKRLKLPNAHHYQVAVALFLKNPQAFSKDNIHKLKAGATLIIPTPMESISISPSEARKSLTQKDASNLRDQLPSLNAPKDTKPSNLEKNKARKKTASAFEKTNKPLNSLIKKKPNVLEKKLIVNVKKIREDISTLENILPNAEQQAKDRTEHLENMQKLLGELEHLISDDEKRRTNLDSKLANLSTQKRAILREKTSYQKKQQALESAASRVDFLSPKNISYVGGVVPESFFLNIANRNRRNKPLSPLLNTAEKLHCAINQDEANSILQKLFNISPKEFNWPDEWMGIRKSTPMIYAGTVDILLATLHRNIQRFPALAEPSERVALQWNYCSIVGENDHFYNLLLKKNNLSKIRAANDVPLKWSGFHQWGFNKPLAKKQYNPTLLNIGEPYHAYEILFHRIHREQCFPQPVSSKRLFDTYNGIGVINRALIPPLPKARTQQYPYIWQPLCDVPQVRLPPEKSWATTLLHRVKKNVEKQQTEISTVTEKIANLEKDYAEQQKRSQLAHLRLEEKIDQENAKEEERKNNLDFQLAEVKTLQLLANKAEIHVYQKIRAAQRQATLEKQVVKIHTQQKAEITQQQTATAMQRAKDYKIIQKYLIMRKVAEKRIQLLREQLQIAELEAGEERLRLLHKELQLAKLAEFQTKQEAGKQRLATLQKQLYLAEKAAEKRLVILRKKLQLAVAEAKQADLATIKAESIAQKRVAALRSLSKKLHNAPEVNFTKAAKPALFSLHQQLRNAPKVNFAKAEAPNKQSAVKKDKRLGVTATVIYTHPLSDEPSATLSLNWKPLENWFARGSLKYTKNEEFTYSWGIGYSDWRPGTASVQLNNWGPIKSGEGLDLDDAVLSISHKVDSEYLRDKKISTTLGLTKPLSGDPAFTATFQWAPVENWYFRTTASQDLQGGPTEWSYGFGYSDWRPNTWRVEYSNYEKNRYPFDNFQKGAVTINRAWEF